MTLGISVYVWMAEMYPLMDIQVLIMLVVLTTKSLLWEMDIQVLIMLVVLTTKSLLRGTFSKLWEVPYLRSQECVALFT